MLAAVALLLSYVESILPLTPGIPGVKLGLPNLIVVLCLYLYGWKEALLMNLARVLLSSFLYRKSLRDALQSLRRAIFFCRHGTVEALAAPFRWSGVSVLGGVFHNIGQLLAAIFVVQTIQIGYYLPWLLIAGCLAGIFNGICARTALNHLPADIEKK